jgi:hypothetical protein
VLGAVTTDGDVESLGCDVDHAAGKFCVDLHLGINSDETSNDAAQKSRAEIVGGRELERAGRVALMLGQFLGGVGQGSYVRAGPLVKRGGRFRRVGPVP